jgi:hypothetical protein
MSVPTTESNAYLPICAEEKQSSGLERVTTTPTVLTIGFLPARGTTEVNMHTWGEVLTATKF